MEGQRRLQAVDRTLDCWSATAGRPQVSFWRHSVLLPHTLQPQKHTQVSHSASQNSLEVITTMPFAETWLLVQNERDLPCHVCTCTFLTAYGCWMPAWSHAGFLLHTQSGNETQGLILSHYRSNKCSSARTGHGADRYAQDYTAVPWRQTVTSIQGADSGLCLLVTAVPTLVSP